MARRRPKPKKPSLSGAIGSNWKGVSFVVALTVLVSGYFVVIHPTVSEFRNGGIYDIDAKEQELSKKQEQLVSFEKMQQQYNNISKTELEKLSRFLPKDQNVPGLIVGLDELTRLSGMHLLAVDTNPRKDTLQGMPTVGVLDVAVSLVGGEYPKLKRFLQMVEQNLRLMDLTALTFRSKSGVYAINLKTYYLIQR